MNFLIFFFFLFILGNVCQSKIHFQYPQRNVLNINLDNIDNIFKTEDFWLIKFYAPQCVHCKKIYNVVINLKKMIQSENKSKVYFGEVNCEDSDATDICSNFNIQKIPQLIIFKKGEILATYNNHINEEYFLKKWVYYATTPLFLEIHSEEELNSYQTEDNRFLVCSTKKDLHPDLLSTAEDFSEENFFLKITNKELCDKLNIQDNVLLVDGDNEHFTYDLNQIQRQSIKSFIKKNRFHVVNKTDHFNFFNLRSSGMNLILLILNLKEDHKDFISQFTEYAEKYKGVDEVVFGYIDGIVYEEALEIYGTHPNKYPQILIFSSTPKEYYFESYFDLDHMDEIMDGLLNKKFTPHKEEFSRKKLLFISLKKHIVSILHFAFKKDLKSFFGFICSVFLIIFTVIMVCHAIYNSIMSRVKECDVTYKNK